MFLTTASIEEHYSTIARTAGALPEYVREHRNPALPGVICRDYFGLMERGVEWVLQPWAREQPRAYAALMGLHPRFLYAESLRADPIDPAITLWSPELFVETDRGSFIVEPDYPSQTLEGWRGHPARARYEALPPAIATAFYSRSRGFAVANQLPRFVTESRVLPACLDCWFAPPKPKAGHASSVAVEALRAVSAENLGAEELLERFHGVLDTREPGDYSRVAEIVLVDERGAGRLFYLRDFDYAGLRVIDNPVEAVDCYLANIFAGCGTKFADGAVLKRV